MGEYIFSYRRFSKFFSFWKKHKVTGHTLDKDQNKMILYFMNGSVQEIVFWSSCEIKLGIDWVLATQKSMEKQTGQSIPLNL